MAATATITFRGTFGQTATVELSSNTASLTETITRSLTTGTGSGQIDCIMTDDNTLGASGSQDYDLDGASIVNMFNESVTFDKVKGIMVYNDGSTNTLTVAGDYLGLSTDTVTVPAGGVFWLDLGAAGIDVTATTADVVTIASTSGTDYRIVIYGVAA